jgi:hypothetical protein
MPSIDSPGMQAAPSRKQHTFMIQHTGYDGAIREGQFTCKKLSIREMTQVTVKKISLNGGLHYDSRHPGKGIDEQTDYTNHMLATLSVCLVQKPVWFDPDTTDDIELMVKIYKECVDYENSFMSPLPGAATSMGGSQASSGGTSEQSGAAGSVTQVGRGQVPASLDP